MQTVNGEKRKIKLPPIGLRIIKSAVAVFICYIVDFLRAGNGIVFYSQLSALWCMQDYTQETKNNALQRTIGTFVGAVHGLIVLVLFRYFEGPEFIKGLLTAATVAIAIVFIIYTTVLLNKRNASYFSCVVFLSIVVNHAGDVNPFIFVLNRVLDTMIGIAIGVLVNTFRIHRKRNRNILFVSGLDDTLLNDNNNMSGYSRVELNRMLDEGLKFTISTVRTPASLIEPLSKIRLKLPVIVMDGAALYNIQEKRFEKVYVISKEEAVKTSAFLSELGFPVFTNLIIDDTVLIYYGDSDNEAYNDIADKLRKSPYRNYIKRPAPKDEPVVYFMIIEKDEDIAKACERLKEAGYDRLLRLAVTKSSEYKGYSYLKIYNKNASKENMMDYLLEQIEVERVVTFGTIEGRYTHIIEPGDSNRVVRIVNREFEEK